MRSTRSRAAKRRAPPLPQPRTGAFMSVEELWREQMPDQSRQQAYALATSGILPFLRTGKRILLIRKPTLEILRGERPPGKAS